MAFAQSLFNVQRCSNQWQFFRPRGPSQWRKKTSSRETGSFLQKPGRSIQGKMLWSSCVWPDLAKFCIFCKNFKVFGHFLKIYLVKFWIYFGKPNLLLKTYSLLQMAKYRKTIGHTVKSSKCMIGPFSSTGKLCSCWTLIYIFHLFFTVVRTF